ncbi:30S ribosomal protein S17 [Patescibacteria group bacterium]|nr:30S ribosomal protein S17 [Patescibacteria group bacterium]MCL5091677.1 30S ribosomal protein S17 [Patescibacteria group bacterium]
MTKTLTGRVVSTKMKHTVVVAVTRKYPHARYKKVVMRQKKYKVHCEDETVKVNDSVVIKETRPVSKDKHFVLIGKVK